MKFTDEDYKRIVEDARSRLADRDSCFDNAPDEAYELLMHIPGLGQYLRKRLKTFDPAFKLTSDIHNGINNLRV